MEGYALGRRLRDIGPPDDMRIVAITGYGQETDRRRAMEAGFNAHIVKPLNLDALARIMAN